MAILDNTVWFVNGNYEFACVDNDSGSITICDAQDTVLYQGNF